MSGPLFKIPFTKSKITNFFLAKKKLARLDGSDHLVDPRGTNNHLCMCDKYMASLQILCPLCSVIFTGSLPHSSLRNSINSSTFAFILQGKNKQRLHDARRALSVNIRFCFPCFGPIHSFNHMCCGSLLLPHYKGIW